MNDLDRARAGDADALARLLAQAAEALRHHIEASMPTRHASVLSADDVLQQTLADAFHDIGRFKGSTDRAFRAWLHAIARRNTIDAVRHLDAERRGGRRRRLSLSRTDSHDVLARRLTPRMTASRAARRRETASLLIQRIDELPADYRTVVREYDLAGRPMAQIAAELGRSPGAGHMLRQRALSMLRERLGSSSRFFSASA